MVARYTRYLPTISLLIALVLPTSAQTIRERSSSFAYIPDKSGGRPLVRVTMDRGIKATFLIDTGSSISIISPELAQRLDLTPKPWLDHDNLPVRLDGKPVWYVQPKKILLGFQPLTVPMVVIESDRLCASSLDPVDGIIGSNALEQFAVLFDFQQHRITTFFGGRLTRQELEWAGMQNATVLRRAHPERGIFAITGSATARIQADFGYSCPMPKNVQ